MSEWFEVTVEVPSELSEAAASLLFDLGSPGLECSEHSGKTSLVAYFRDPPSLVNLGRLCSSMGQGEPVVRTRTILEQDWAENWKRNFRSLPVGDRLLVCPPWDIPASTDRAVVVIEPGMAFGTGQHPTTQGCLELILEAVTSHRISRALDVGTGSGILAVALAKLGVESVCAIDTDPAACETAVANLEKNRLATAIQVTTEWHDVKGSFDLIVANLFSNLLRDLSGDLRGRLAAKGSLICSGFLRSDEHDVVHAYPDLQIARRRDREDWVTLMLSRLDSPN